MTIKMNHLKLCKVIEPVSTKRILQHSFGCNVVLAIILLLSSVWKGKKLFLSFEISTPSCMCHYTKSVRNLFKICFIFYSELVSHHNRIEPNSGDSDIKNGFYSWAACAFFFRMSFSILGRRVEKKGGL